MRMVNDGFRISDSNREIRGTVIIESDSENQFIGQHRITAFINGQLVGSLVNGQLMPTIFLDRATPNYGMVLGNVSQELMREMGRRFNGTAPSPLNITIRPARPEVRRNETESTEAIGLLTLLALKHFENKSR